MLQQSTVPTEYRNPFANIYWGCQEELPLTKVKSLNCHVKDGLKTAMPTQHLSFKGMKPILMSMAHCISLELIKSIRCSKWIGIMVDESSDCSGNEILLLYVKFFCKADQKIKEAFVQSFKLEKLTAQHFNNSVLDENV